MLQLLTGNLPRMFRYILLVTAVFFVTILVLSIKDRSTTYYAWKNTKLNLINPFKSTTIIGTKNSDSHEKNHGIVVSNELKSEKNLSSEFYHLTTLAVKITESRLNLNISKYVRDCQIYRFRNYTLPGIGCQSKIGLRTMCVKNLVKSDMKTPEKDEIMISIVTQLSCERLVLLELLASRWPHPISAVLFLSKSHSCTSVQLENAIKFARKHSKIELNLVKSDDQEIYPFNFLRALAPELSPATHFVYIDTDLVPPPSLHSILMQHLESLDWSLNMTLLYDMAHVDPSDKIAFVIPAFDFVNPKEQDRNLIIKDRQHMIRLWKENVTKPIRIDYWWPGHGPTDFGQWKRTHGDYEVAYRPSFEPYILVPREAPKPDIRFVGAHQDKIAFIHEINAAKYRFVVLYEGFVYHMKHQQSLSKRRRSYYTSCITKLFKQFMAELKVKYNRL